MFNIFLTAVFVGCAHGFADNAHLCDLILTVDCKTHYTPGEPDESLCASDNNTYQNYLLTVDCKTHYTPGEPDESLCASDNNTFPNYCEYSHARCKTPQTHIAYIGQCMFTTTGATTIPTAATTPVLTTTMQTTMGTTTIDELMKVFCASKGAINCPTDLDPMCGSDGNFYLNKCEFSKQTCDDPTLTIKTQDACIG